MFTGPVESYPHLLGDIGGTHARFALLTAPGAAPSHGACLRCAEHPGLLQAIQAYLAGLDICPPRHAAFGIATPVTGDHLQVTNNNWSFSIRALKHELNLDKLLFINDFSALALSLPHLGSHEKRQVGGGHAVPGYPFAVIGPGTGLGVSALIPAGAQFIPLDGEGGHVSLSPHTDEELHLTALLARQHGHVSAERILCGSGIALLHQALAQLRGQPAEMLTTPAITAAGISGADTLCEATLSTFCSLLGSTAGNLALTLGARGGVFIGGGIVPKLGNYFDQSPFRARFEAKGRFTDYLAHIPTSVITAETPAILGAAAALVQYIASEPREDDWCMRTSDWLRQPGIEPLSA